MHRVGDEAPSRRITLAYFTEPDYDTLASPLPCCGDPKYDAIRFGDFMHQRDILHIPGRGAEVPKEFWEADLSVAEKEARAALTKASI